jgi:DNA-binding CsgD family transcriptional regulator
MKGLDCIEEKVPECTQFTFPNGAPGHYVNSSYQLSTSFDSANSDISCNYPNQAITVSSTAHMFERLHNKKNKRSTTDYYNLIRLVCLERLRLTSREIDCYFLVAEGYRTKEIGKALGISYRTVEKHIENIKVKLGCNTFAGIISTISRYLFNEIA